jgi:hypothetical protein
MKTLAIISALLLVQAAAAEHPLVPATGEVILLGDHDSDTRPGPKPLKATLTTKLIGEGPWGQAVELRFACGRSRSIPPMQLIIRPDRSVYRIDFGDKYEFVKTWATTNVRKLLSDMIIPPLVIKDDSLTIQKGSVWANDNRSDVIDSPERVQWRCGPATTSITLDPLHQTLRFLWLHRTGHYTTMVWQRGVGLIHAGAGSDAGADGWKLSRSYAPAPTTAAPPMAPDIATLFGLLPREAMPIIETMPSLGDPVLRASYCAASTDVDRQGQAAVLNCSPWLIRSESGYMQIDAIGASQSLQCALWKRADGSRLLGLNLLNQVGQSKTTSDLRLYEWRAGQFRLATYTDLWLPEPADFVKNPKKAQRGGHIVGTWQLPQDGTTIRVAPQPTPKLSPAPPPSPATSQMASPTSVTPADFRFEFTWDGSTFDRNQVSNLTPPVDQQ